MSNGDVFLRVTFALRVSMMRLYLFFYLGVFLDYTVVSLPYSYRVIFAEWFLHSDSFACLQAICFRFAASFSFSSLCSLVSVTDASRFLILSWLCPVLLL